MSGGRPARTATLVVTVILATHPLAAQVAATVDMGVSGVHYDGFLPSTAASVTPAFRFEALQLFVRAAGTYLEFESGHKSLQGNLTASAFTLALHQLRGELLTSIGASTYADFASFSHALIGPRIHLASDRQGAWVTGSLGTTSYGSGQRPVTTAALGTWAQRFGATWLLTGTYNHVGDTTYIDLEGALHAPRWGGRFTVDGVLGVRGWSQGGGHGVYGEATAALAITEHLAFVVSGGRYPTDPIWGSVSGRYLGVAFRLTALPWHATSVASPPAAPPPAPLVHHSSPVDPADPPPPASRAVTVQVRPCSCNGRTLVVMAGPVASVDVAGDFTDWEPVPLASSAAGEWAATLGLGPGTYRFNIRINGGEWTVPAGVTAVTDEYGGLVGLLTVP